MSNSTIVYSVYPDDGLAAGNHDTIQCKQVKVRDLMRLIENDGWRHVRTTGSHRHYKRASKPSVVTIPGHPGDDVPAGTLKSILKAAGLEARK